MVGERLAEIRKDHDDTQAALAKKLNVSVTTVRSWEQEKSSPTMHWLPSVVYTASQQIICWGFQR